MKHYNISEIRICNQHILGNRFKSVKEITEWMGAMQAQDYEMSKWALGIRLPGSTEKTVQSAMDSGMIIRTHVLRPTWHIISSKAARWMISLTAPHILSSLKSRQKGLGLTTAVLKKSNKIIERILSSNKQVIREELVIALEKGGILNTDNRISHVLLCAELDMLICSGRTIGKKQSYALFDERVPGSPALQREEALTRLATVYFNSHGPATLKDFIWWSGLPVTDAKKGLEYSKPGLISEKYGEKTYWFTESSAPVPEENHRLILLPGFDEYIISYRDRSAVIPGGKHEKAISSNGIFWPVVLIDGKAAGTWKRANKNGKLIITMDLFTGNHKLSGKAIKRHFEESATAYGSFLGLETEVIVNSK